jgi:hypothetical protein
MLLPGRNCRGATRERRPGARAHAVSTGRASRTDERDRQRTGQSEGGPAMIGSPSSDARRDRGGRGPRGGWSWGHPQRSSRRRPVGENREEKAAGTRAGTTRTFRLDHGYGREPEEPKLGSRRGPVGITTREPTGLINRPDPSGRCARPGPRACVRYTHTRRAACQTPRRTTTCA